MGGIWALGRGLVYLGLGLLRGLVYLGLGLTRVFASIVIDMTVLQFCTALTALKSATNYSVRVGSARDAKDSDSNYLERSKNSMTLILREYKTSKKYGEKRIELNSKLTGLLRDYLRHNKTGWLLINERTGEPMSGHNITTRLQRITKDRLGKKVGSNMLRHSYLSHKYADTTEEMKKDSNIMGHSVEVQQKFYVKSS